MTVVRQFLLLTAFLVAMALPAVGQSPSPSAATSHEHLEKLVETLEDKDRR